jgi:tRNA(Ile)-lysidine synthase
MVVRDLDGRVQLAPAGEIGFTNDCRNLRLSSAEKKVTFAGVRIRWDLRPLPLEPAFGRKGCELFDADKLGEDVVLRRWAPGDRFQPIGMVEEVKLQDLFTNCKIPRRRRHELLVAATATGDIFWIEDLRISERFKLTKRTRRCLDWRWKRL